MSMVYEMYGAPKYHGYFRLGVPEQELDGILLGLGLVMKIHFVLVM